MTWWNRPQLKGFDGLICDGAVRSGKTMSMVLGFFLWSMASFNGQCFGICGKNVGALRRNVILPLGQWLGGTLEVTDHRSENKLVVRDETGKTNTYYLFGGENERSYMRIQGVTLAGVFLDEAALMPRSFVEQACARCSVEGSKFWFNCNPAGPEHWFYREWIQKREQKNLLYLHFTMADNPGLSDKVRRRYAAMYTGAFYRRYVLGLWCASEGLIYRFDREKHIAKTLPERGEYYISVDYGTQNPLSAGLWCVGPDRAVRLREYYYAGREQGAARTDEEHYRELEKLAGELLIRQVIVDPSAASLIAAIRRHGRFSVRKARNEVLPGIQLVAALLRAGALQFSPDCRDTIREFGLYSWQEGCDAPKKEDDHAMDDIRYFCATVLRRNRKFMEKIGGSIDEEVAD